MRHPESESRGAAPARPDLPWYQRLNITTVSLIIFVLAIGGSLPAMRGSGRDLDHTANFLRFVKRFFPPDFSVADQIFEALVETVQIAVLATFFSVVLAFPLAAAGAQTLSPRWLVALARMILNCVRTIPSLIWALIAVAVVGPYPLAGVLGLSFYSLGYLGKFFSDAFESVDLEVARGLRAIGAGRIQAFQHGLWPNARPLIWSYSLDARVQHSVGFNRRVCGCWRRRGAAPCLSGILPMGSFCRRAPFYPCLGYLA